MNRCASTREHALSGMTPRPLRTLLALLVPLAALAACGPDLRFERDSTVAIPPGSTWAWSIPDDDGLAPDDGAITPNDSVARMMTAAVEAELVAHGFPKAHPDSAAFIVHYHLGRRSVTDTVPPRPDRPSGATAGEVRGSWGGYGLPEDLEGRTVTWEEGMLILDVLPRDRSTVAWRGVMAGEIPAAAAARPAEAIRTAVKRLLRDFPEP